MDRVKAILGSGCEIDIYSGDDASALDLLMAGGKGVISVAANVVPNAFHDMCMFALAGEFAKAKQIEGKFLSKSVQVG